MVVISVIRLGTPINPSPYLSVAVGKIESARPIMVTGREIDDLPTPGSDRGESVHFGDEEAVVDAVVPFIQQNKRFGGSGCGHVADFFDDRVARCPGTG